MKKIYIIIASSIAVLFLSIVIGIQIYESVSFNGIEQIHVMKTNYTYNTYDDSQIEVLIYSNDPKSFLKEYKDVVCLFSDGGYTSLAGTIEEAKRVSSHNYNDQRVYGYKLYITPAGVNLEDNFKNCIFSTRDFEVVIGNLSVVGLRNKNSNLDFSKIYAVGNEHLGYKSINAFVVTFTNSGTTPIYVTDFYIGEYNNVNLGEAYIHTEDIKYGDDIKQYITNYKPLNYGNNSGAIEVPSKGSVKVLIPVYYSGKAFLGNTLIYINDSLYINNYNYLTNYDDLDSYEDIIVEGQINNS